ncbi:hypothetical protein FLW53_21955 [Microbispora sp. SCL1-1]|uniref:CPCC family cysteine-rich protein n=1 Tax=Microbispora sp. SCL1-1 TaxID=2592812 RepID=UPI001159A36E|nr:hypothetical protein [Microbispora sp. CL1-1]TQS11999.1 hypothetical protein FLW53_21955 [Microbispora sp. SCL1-1]
MTAGIRVVRAKAAPSCCGYVANGVRVEFVNIRRPKRDKPYPCPCCGFLALNVRGGYEICPVCFREDDGQDDHDACRVEREYRGPRRPSMTRAPVRRGCSASVIPQPFMVVQRCR